MHQQVSRTLPGGQTEYKEYDELGRIRKATDFDGHVAGYFYNDLGQLQYQEFFDNEALYVAENPAEVYEYIYDDLGRRTQVKVDGVLTEEFDYDEEGNLEGADSPQGKVGYTYNSITSQRTSTRAYQKGSTTTIYADTSYGHDDLGRLEIVSDNIAVAANTYAYNAVGSRSKMELGNSASPYYVYDALNRLTELKNHVSKYEPPATEPARLSEFAYELYADGMRKSVEEHIVAEGTPETRTVDYTYDNLNRLTREVAVRDGAPAYGYTIDYTYDLVGNRTYRKVTVTNSSGVQELHTKYTHDPDTDQLEKEEFSDQQIAMAVPFGDKPVYAYAQPGGGIGYQTADGTPLNSWSAFWRGLPHQWNRYTHWTAWGLLMLVLVIQLLLENLHRLRRATDTYYPRPRYSLATRTIALVLVFTFILGPSEFQQLAQADTLYQNLSTNGWGQIDRTIDYTYDNNGSLLSKTTKETSTSTVQERLDYQYNYQGRLCRVITDLDSSSGTNPVDVVDYTYNDAGIRVSTYTFTVAQDKLDEPDEQTYATGKQTTLYLIDPQNLTGYAQVITELTYNKSNPDPATDTPASIRSYTIGDDMLAQTDDPLGSGTPEYLLYDGHGSTRQLVDGSQTIQGSYSYDAYGMMLGGNPTTSNPAATNLLYTGEQYDNNLQQYYLRARYYDPSNGRFNCMDDFAGNTSDPQSLHKYAYCHANPINAIDPSGMMEFSLTGLTISMAIGATIGAVVGGVYAHYTQQSIWKGILIGAGVGAILGASFYLLFTGITSGALQRFFWDPRTFRTISQQYWRQFGPANGSSLHHWLIPQRWSWIPQGIRNAGFNLLRLPDISVGSLGLNQWMGFALRWGGSRMIVACLVENGIRILIPVTAYATYHAGKWVGNELAEEAIELTDGSTATPIQLNQEEMRKMQDDGGEALLSELE